MADRARQFLPFDALTGFKREIKKREKIIVKKKELAEDEEEILDYKLQQLKVGNMVSVIYYSDGEYLKKEGLITKIDLYEKTISIVKTSIKIEDIINIDSEIFKEYLD